MSFDTFYTCYYAINVRFLFSLEQRPSLALDWSKRTCKVSLDKSNIIFKSSEFKCCGKIGRHLFKMLLIFFKKRVKWDSEFD